MIRWTCFILLLSVFWNNVDGQARELFRKILTGDSPDEVIKAIDKLVNIKDLKVIEAALNIILDDFSEDTLNIMRNDVIAAMEKATQIMKEKQDQLKELRIIVRTCTLAQPADHRLLNGHVTCFNHHIKTFDIYLKKIINSFDEAILLISKPLQQMEKHALTRRKTEISYLIQDSTNALLELKIDLNLCLNSQLGQEFTNNSMFNKISACIIKSLQ